MATQTRKQLEDRISDLCDQAGCNEKIAKIHKAQFVDRRWNPHPSQKFVNWWVSTGWEATERKTQRTWQGLNAVTAFNCEAVRECYTEAKQIGIV